MLEKYIAKLEFAVDFCRGRHPRRTLRTVMIAPSNSDLSIQTGNEANNYDLY